MGNRTESEEVCEACGGTGKVETFWTNPETHLPEPDGEEECGYCLEERRGDYQEEL